jgi:hypothetical protein
VKLQNLIVPAVAAAALAAGCANWNAHDRGDDYQCGYAGSIKGHTSASAGRHGWSGCGSDYAAAAGADGLQGISTSKPELAALDHGRQTR